MRILEQLEQIYKGFIFYFKWLLPSHNYWQTTKHCTLKESGFVSIVSMWAVFYCEMTQWLIVKSWRASASPPATQQWFTALPVALCAAAAGVFLQRWEGDAMQMMLWCVCCAGVSLISEVTRTVELLLLQLLWRVWSEALQSPATGSHSDTKTACTWAGW